MAKKSDCKLFFDNQEITQAEHYKYVGNIIKPVHASHGDIFGDNYNFLCDKAQKACRRVWCFCWVFFLLFCFVLFCFFMFFMFNTLIQPILLYGSEIWGVCKTGCTVVDIFHNDENFKTYCQSSIENKFRRNWELDVQNVEKNPILRTYAKIKTTFGIEIYIDSVRNFRYRYAITKIRTSSHTLEIEKGRHRKDGGKIPACQRLCQNFSVVEDEIHLVMDCTISLSERRTLFNKITTDYNPFENLDDMSKFQYLFSTENAQHLKWLGKLYIHVLVNVSTNDG